MDTVNVVVELVSEAQRNWFGSLGEWIPGMAVAAATVYLAIRSVKHDRSLREIEVLPILQVWVRHETARKYGGLDVSNSGRGHADMVALFCGDEKVADLPETIPAGGAIFYSAKGLPDKVTELNNENCYFLYRDALQKLHRQYFRLDLNRMVAVPKQRVDF